MRLVALALVGFTLFAVVNAGCKSHHKHCCVTKADASKKRCSVTACAATEDSKPLTACASVGFGKGLPPLGPGGMPPPGPPPQSATPSSSTGPPFKEMPTVMLGLEDELSGTSVFFTTDKKLAPTSQLSGPREKFEFMLSKKDPNGYYFLMATIDGVQEDTATVELIMHPAEATIERQEAVQLALSEFANAMKNACKENADKVVTHTAKQKVIDMSVIQEMFNAAMDKAGGVATDYKLTDYKSQFGDGRYFVQCPTGSVSHGVQVNTCVTVKTYASDKFATTLTDGRARETFKSALAAAKKVVTDYNITNEAFCAVAALMQTLWVAMLKTSKTVLKMIAKEGQLKNKYGNMPKTSSAQLLRTCPQGSAGAQAAFELFKKTDLVDKLFDALCPSNTCPDSAAFQNPTAKVTEYSAALKQYLSQKIPSVGAPRPAIFQGETATAFGYSKGKGVPCDGPNDGVCPYAAYNTFLIDVNGVKEPSLVTEVRDPASSPIGGRLVPLSNGVAKKWAQICSDVNTFRTINGLAELECDARKAALATMGGPPPPPPPMGGGPPPPPPMIGFGQTKKPGVTKAPGQGPKKPALKRQSSRKNLNKSRKSLLPKAMPQQQQRPKTTRNGKKPTGTRPTKGRKRTRNRKRTKGSKPNKSRRTRSGKKTRQQPKSKRSRRRKVKALPSNRKVRKRGGKKRKGNPSRR